MRFLIDECLHTSLVDVVVARGYEAQHVNWLGLSGISDRALMSRVLADDFTFVTNNASDFRKLYAKTALHAGLIIIVPNVGPDRQRELLDAVLEGFAPGEEGANEAIEIRIENGEAVIDRYALPEA